VLSGSLVLIRSPSVADVLLPQWLVLSSGSRSLVAGW